MFIFIQNLLYGVDADHELNKKRVYLHRLIKSIKLFLPAHLPRKRRMSRLR
jgi:hypothetical protein